MRKNKGLLTTTIILGILVILLGGYIVYNNFIKTDDNSDKQNNYQSGYLLDLISENDKNKLNEENNYKNIEISINDLSLTFNCTGFGGAPGDYCYHTEISLNGKKVHEYDTVVGDINTNPYIIITEKNLIVQRTDSNEIEIFDKTGKSLKLINNVVYSYKNEEDTNYTNKHMYLENNKLYFNTYNGESVSAFSVHKIYSKFIDLSNSKFNIVDAGNSFEGNISCKEC